MKFIISTLGCKVNQYESQAMETFFMDAGHEPASPGEAADAVIINTCAVTAESGRKSRQVIRRLRDENPGAVLGVCGCYSQLSPEVADQLGAGVVFGSGDREKFVRAVEKAVEEGAKTREVDKPFDRRVFEKLPAGAVPGRTRAMLKIQDGCVNFCTYCIIPYTRGRLRSLPVEDAVKETRRLAEEGYRELVLTGIEVASYGKDLAEAVCLTDIVLAAAEAAGNMRIRLGSLEPTVITEDFCSRLAATGKLCRHFHLSLQSGCDRTLKNMNRKYDTACFFEKTELLRKYFPGCALTCDVIAGFPGETDEDQAATLAFVKKCGFAAMHVFPYSRRPGTPADKMPDQCSNAVKNARCRQLQQAASELKLQYMQTAVGTVLPVLFEASEDENSCTGHSDTYQTVRVEGQGLKGLLRNVRITGIDGDVLTGVIDN